jgi:S-adenosylmethionine:tRNA-ribosyltransferase-isomerase (queuine synthetase)
MSSLVAKRITQETFDEVVKENVEEFEMDEKEAIAEAVKQFESQGVSLANVETPNVQALEAMVAKLDRSKSMSLLIRRGQWAQYTVIRPVR